MTGKEVDAAVQEYESLKGHAQALQEKLVHVTNDLREHKRVLETIEDIDSDRVAYRLVGEVLIKETVKEVKPYLSNTIASLQEVVKKLEEQLVGTEKQLLELREKIETK